MKLFVVLSCIALAVAKPQGYSYNQPSGGLGLSAGAAPAFSGSSFGTSGGSFGTSGSTTFGSSVGSFGAGAGAPATSFPSGGSFGTSGSTSFGSSVGSFGAGAPATSFSSGSTFDASGSSAGSFGAGAPAGVSAGSAPAQVVVQKHIYVHVPPPSVEEESQPRSVAPVQAQKHYKIIFIKAPSGPSIKPEQLQQLAQPQTEEKTIVYVLSKKQESLSEVAEQVKPAPVTPSKPEVYFIKYKTEKEQHAAAAPADSTFSNGVGASGSDASFSGSLSGLSTDSFSGSSSGLAGGFSGSSSFESGHQAVSVSAPSVPSSNYIPASAPVAHKPASEYGPAH